MSEGLTSGLLTLVPSAGLVYLLTTRSAKFMARTNMQSRTALAIMPALFAFVWTAETRLSNKMREMAKESEHSQASVRWAEEQVARSQKHQQQQGGSPMLDTEAHLMQLYQQSVEESGVRIVPGDQLQWYHSVSNFVSANPIRVVAALAVPSVAWIFYGRSGKDELKLSVKLLHTRVFGQFVTLSCKWHQKERAILLCGIHCVTVALCVEAHPLSRCLSHAVLLGVVGFKEYMDQQGTFITQAQADGRVEEMKQVRETLLARLNYDRQRKQKQDDKLAAAHAQDQDEVAQKKKKA